MNNPINLNVYLPDGSPDNFIVVSTFNWAGECVKCSRQNLVSLFERYKTAVSAVYFLFSGGDDALPIKVYIGETEDVVTRINQHLTDKDKSWLEEVVIFTCEKGFSKGHIKNLEYKLIQLTKTTVDYSVTNTNRGKESSLPEYMYPEVSTFLDYIKMIMPILGYQGLLAVKKAEKSPNINKNNVNLVGYLGARGILLQGRKFRVFKDSKMNKKEVPSCGEHVKFTRKRLIEIGVVDSETFTFVKDYDFNSPSAAAGAIYGGSVNGWVVWKNSQNNTLNQITLRDIEKRIKSKD